VKIYEANNKALKIWMKATGFKADEPNILGNLYHYHEEIRQAQEVDPTALTTFMILRSSARSFAAETEFNALEFLENPEAVLKRTEALRQLLAILKDPECQEEVARFQASLKESAKTMELFGTVGKLIDDVQELAYIRRDALLAFKELKVHHFGAGRRGDGKPKYNENVIKFWNMNSVVRAAQVQPKDGITMVMVRDPVDLFSYFCFLVVNGESITVISDLPDQPHPFHKYMSRSRAQERRFEGRAMRLRFPYQLFDFKFNDDGRYAGERTKTGLARTSIEAVLVNPIKDLEPDQALWAMMMFDLLAEQYWHQEQKPVELSYTADGMRQARPDVPASKALALPGQAFVVPLTRMDMRRDQLAGVFERKPTGQNDWMEDRYGPLVPEQAFNLIGTEKVHRLLNGTGVKCANLVPKTEDVGAIFNTGTIGWKNKSWSLSAIEPTLFGTPAQMESDRRFIARFNQAIVIEAEATKEFHARKDEVARWYEERVKENLGTLLRHVALGKFESEKQDYKPHKNGKERADFDNGVPQPGNILHQDSGKGPAGWRYQVELYTLNSARTKYLCHMSGQQASVWSYFTPMTPKSIADIAGCRIKDLPDVLHHWYRNERYHGNSILDRLDPLDWKCDNPWRSMHFEVMIGLSKSSFNVLLKKHGLPRRTPKERES
jgi:hypothetical protein